ncbi:hypothetical protein BJV78DRAFT_153630 [Lactifluus subvellereus]|nr:hypothetical protein BJV78DRAFT_153630 [Lactifluus subvellereus]
MRVSSCCTRRHSQSRLNPDRLSRPFPGTRIELGRIHMTEEHQSSHDVMEGWCDPSRPFQLPRDECGLPKWRMIHPLNESNLPNNSNVMYNRTALRPRVSRVAAATAQRPEPTPACSLRSARTQPIQRAQRLDQTEKPRPAKGLEQQDALYWRRAGRHRGHLVLLHHGGKLTRRKGGGNSALA